MKKALFCILFLSLFFTACEEPGDAQIQPNSTEIVEQDSIRTIEGEFIYLSDAAVFKGKDFIYGVELDSTALELAEKIKPLKTDDFDLVPVTLKVKILPNPGHKGWEEIAEILEVVEIPEAANDTIAPSVETIVKKP